MKRGCLHTVNVVVVRRKHAMLAGMSTSNNKSQISWVREDTTVGLENVGKLAESRGREYSCTLHSAL